MAKRIATKKTCVRVSRNPHMDDVSWKADHWRCTLTRKGKKMQVHFSKGAGHKGKEPTTAEIFESLALDAGGFESADGFASWADEYGYEHTAKAKKTYKAVASEATRLRKFLGDKLYERLVFGGRR